MLAKVWLNNNFAGTESRVSGNDGRGFCQVCDLVRFTTRRGESLLKACEKINRGWSVQSYSSFEIVIVIPVVSTVAIFASQRSFVVLVVCPIGFYCLQTVLVEMISCLAMPAEAGRCQLRNRTATPQKRHLPFDVHL